MTPRKIYANAASVKDAVSAVMNTIQSVPSAEYEGRHYAIVVTVQTVALDARVAAVQVVEERLIHAVEDTVPTAAGDATNVSANVSEKYARRVKPKGWIYYVIWVNVRVAVPVVLLVQARHVLNAERGE